MSEELEKVKIRCDVIFNFGEKTVIKLRGENLQLLVDFHGSNLSGIDMSELVGFGRSVALLEVFLVRKVEKTGLVLLRLLPTDDPVAYDDFYLDPHYISDEGRS